ncbi:MAG: hypothetical protein O7F74_09865 [Bacteroidetes bacterium]|nr:hypothetical protein [Bacteroidota bacterium]
MKRIVFISFAALLFLASACKGTKYCPTYSKEPTQKEIKDSNDKKA